MGSTLFVFIVSLRGLQLFSLRIVSLCWPCTQYYQLDHVITTGTGVSLITDMYIENTFISSNHLPLYVQLDLEGIEIYEDNKNMCRQNIDWSKLSTKDMVKYKYCWPIYHFILTC